MAKKISVDTAAVLRDSLRIMQVNQKEIDAFARHYKISAKIVAYYHEAYGADWKDVLAMNIAVGMVL
jgi:hypothetical protein